MTEEEFQGFNYLDISKIESGTIGKAIAYALDTQGSISKTERPFYKIFLKDCKGNGVYGYIFDVENYIQQGIVLSQVKGKFVYIEYTENYLSNFGLTLSLHRLSLITNPQLLDQVNFIGKIPDYENLFKSLKLDLENILEKQIDLSYLMTCKSYPNFCDGRIGGLILHYFLVLKQLTSYKLLLSEVEFYNLISCFTIFIQVHVYTLNNSGNLDIDNIIALTKTVSNLLQVLNCSCRAEEIIHYFFGYSPKDFFVRLVISQFQAVSKTTTEFNAYSKLPINQEVNISSGVLKRYSQE